MPGRPPYSCIRCADRKVKCDRERPCASCAKHDVVCIYNTSQAPRKKSVKLQALSERLRYYEALLEQEGIDPGKVPAPGLPKPEPRSLGTTLVSNNVQLQISPSIDSEATAINKTQVVHGQGRYQLVDNSLWTRVVEEFRDPEDALKDSSNEPSDLDTSDDDLGFVLSAQTESKARPRHPPAEHIHQLWQIFMDNVDPLTKIIHPPTVRPAIQKAASDTGSIPRNFEAFMFAVYAVAVVSLKDEDCKEMFKEPRKKLLSRYVSATKKALSRAKFMSTTSLIVLQSLIIHILTVRSLYQPRATWSLTGVAVRIAQSMGLDRDGLALGLPPFEVEIRRRVWWLLRTHDFHTSEICGLAKFRHIDIGPESPKWPTNVNDDQLYPGMTSTPVESTAVTDFFFVALRYELTKFVAARVTGFRQQGKDASQWDSYVAGSQKEQIEKALAEMEELIEMRYLRYCDPSQPLHLMTMLMARSAMMLVRFRTHHPRRWAGASQTLLSERQLVWQICIRLLEQHNMVLTNPVLKRFAWHAAYFMHWHSLIHLLDTLRATPDIADAERAWHLISSTYENNPNMISDMRQPIHVAVGNLCLKAYSVREAALETKHTPLPSTPRFISELRQQREATEAKRRARGANADKAKDPANQRPTVPDAASFGKHNLLVPDAMDLQQSVDGSAVADDPFWIANGFDDGQYDHSDEAMNVDVSLMLDYEGSVVSSTLPTISWEQWDAWVTESNVMGPPASPRN